MQGEQGAAGRVEGAPSRSTHKYFVILSTHITTIESEALGASLSPYHPRCGGRSGRQRSECTAGPRWVGPRGLTRPYTVSDGPYWVQVSRVWSNPRIRVRSALDAVYCIFHLSGSKFISEGHPSRQRVGRQLGKGQPRHIAPFSCRQQPARDLRDRARCHLWLRPGRSWSQTQKR